MKKEQIYKLLTEVKDLSRGLPIGQRNRIINKCNKVVSFIRKQPQNDKDMSEEYTQQQIADRYIANQAIMNALISGRKITLLDSAEFGVSEMHTQMHCIRAKIEKHSLPYKLQSRWVEIGKFRKKCKEYWIESNEVKNN